MPLATTIDGSATVSLDAIDPGAVGGLSQAEAEDRLATLSDRLAELGQLVFAAEEHGVLLILQGMDAAGKDVTIQQVFAVSDPQAVRVRHFTKMTEEEELHGFLWRAHAQAPKRGEIVIFDRSYYEQVIRPQVEDDHDAADVDERVEDVRAFEAILRRAGIIIVKVFLHVSPRMQEQRLRERMEKPDEAWKISATDWKDRRAWDRFMRAWERTMQRTASAEEPWHVVPADEHWAHSLAVAELLVDRLGEYEQRWAETRDRLGAEARSEAEEEAPDAERDEVDEQRGAGIA